ncbi:hypothetical protein GGD81_002580 [Rhodobium orientis]|uniref:hypothetical protein n=1 Tax=Rhodobium orientis TaxID=34017 RepID=UPI00147593D2|nr:hypothetical protein [Rhodobium orientis]MBB4303537.1 hypothetical protein [Rhodobium orientis]
MKSWEDPHFNGGLLLCLMFLASGTLFYSSVEGWHWIVGLFAQFARALLRDLK